GGAPQGGGRFRCLLGHGLHLGPFGLLGLQLLRGGLILVEHKDKYPKDQYKANNGVDVQLFIFHEKYLVEFGFPGGKYMPKCPVYDKLAFFCFCLCSCTALTKPTKRGCGLATVLLYSGWYCTPTNQGWSGISTPSTRPVSGL